jgi:hypothetical protein
VKKSVSLGTLFGEPIHIEIDNLEVRLSVVVNKTLDDREREIKVEKIESFLRRLWTDEFKRWQP